MISTAAVRSTALLLLLPLCGLAGFALSGCGNKGPLYLPPPPVEQQGAPLEQAPASTEQDNGAE